MSLLGKIFKNICSRQDRSPQTMSIPEDNKDINVINENNRPSFRWCELAAMKTRFPQLEAILDSDQDPELLYEQACSLIALIHPPAKEAAYRSRLKNIGTEGALREIALSDISEGIPYSSNVRKFPDLWEIAKPDILAHEEQYGGAVFTQAWPSLSRGRALVYYFSHHRPKGSVLHIAPEKELEEWMRSNVKDYHTLGIGVSNDLAEDLTDLTLPDSSFDLVICHRVLEHIFDEAAALNEIQRILKSDGIFNVSVPESMHLSDTLEWCYPDASHHNHYRQYGSDFKMRVNKSGFETDVVRWFLDKSEGELQKAGTYPFRMYNAHPITD